MKPSDYPPQEPLSPLGEAYQARIFALGEGIHGEEFAYGDDPYQSLEIFEAERPTGDVLLFMHGGGWTSGYKEWMSFMAPAFNALGVTFVSAGYRLAPGHVFPAGFEDAADACAWVVRHIAAHGGDAARVFVGGHSAGGHWAALLAATAEWRRARGLPDDCIRGALAVSGVYRFGAEGGLSMRPRFLGSASDAEVQASPLLRLQPATCPPLLITHGSRDFAHLIVQAQQMAAALSAAGVAVQTEIIEGADHFEASIACGQADSGWPAKAAAWMRQVRSTTHPTTGDSP
jgi:arylformamidase